MEFCGAGAITDLVKGKWNKVLLFFYLRKKCMYWIMLGSRPADWLVGWLVGWVSGHVKNFIIMIFIPHTKVKCVHLWGLLLFNLL